MLQDLRQSHQHHCLALLPWERILPPFQQEWNLEPPIQYCNSATSWFRASAVSSNLSILLPISSNKRFWSNRHEIRVPGCDVRQPASPLSMASMCCTLSCFPFGYESWNRNRCVILLPNILSTLDVMDSLLSLPWPLDCWLFTLSFRAKFLPAFSN